MPIHVDRKSESHSQVRNLAALAATSLAAVTLLIGPDATLGLDVPTAGGAVSGATQVTQQVTTTVQQTTQQVTTTVQQTAAPVVQQTQQVVTQVQQTAAPVTTAAPKAAAPATSVTKAAAPKVSAPSKAVAKQVRQVAAKAGGASSSVTTTARAVTRSAATATHAAAAGRVAKRRGTTRSRPEPQRTADAPTCGADALVGLLSPLLTTISADSLTTLLCDATNLLNPAQGTQAATAKSLAPALATVVASAVPGQLRVLGTLMKGKQPGIGVKRSSGGVPLADAAGKRSHAVAGLQRTPSVMSIASTASATTAPHDASAALAAEVAGAKKHGGLFGSSVTGTEAIFALLAADWALLVALAMWKLARRRRFVPLFS